jgi:uncharacterized damage-inducible protein DinB
MPDGQRAPLSTHQLHFLRFAQYNTWFNGQLYKHVAALDDVERKRDRGVFFQSIHDTLDHILLCDRSWLSRIERSGLPFRSLTHAELVPDLRDLSQGVTQDFDALQTERRATDAVLEAFVRELTPELLATNLEYKNSKGTDFANPLWHVVAHVFNHQTHHRGQVTALLTQIEIDPGFTDFIITAMMPLDEVPGGPAVSGRGSPFS